MYFPVSGETISPLLLAAVGGLVGLLGGFFGVGGGFLAGPLMYWAGLPMNFVVGTDLAHMTGKSIVAAKEHRALGHVDFKLGLLMVVGTVIGIEVGAQLIEHLKRIGSVEPVVATAYIALLLGVSALTAWEATVALRESRAERVPADAASHMAAIAQKVQRWRLPPMVSLPMSGIASISVWAIVGIALVTGVLSGFLGVGGGFIRLPSLVYIIGAPTHTAIGTDLFEIVISASYGTITHALKGNVDILVALIMHTGAALGAKFGARLTTRFTGPHIRLAFAALPLLGAALVLMRLEVGGH